VIGTLHFATASALNDAGLRKSLTDLGVDIVGSTPKEFDAYIKAEIPKWAAVVKASGARLD
jgi:tripartite-type tricarboxylate transporter receptor subunit TctC